MLVFQQERLSQIISELPEIFYRHWQDIGRHKEAIPLDPAYDEYGRLESCGFLHIVTARDEGKLAGYLFSVVHPHLHYRKSLTAYTDLMYLRREYTRGFGIFRYAALILQSEKMLRDMGVQKRYLMTKVYHDLTPLFQRLGYRFIEKISAKLL